MSTLTGSRYTAPSPEQHLTYLGTSPVPAGPYYRHDYFELEREAIFKRSWLEIGHVCELPRPGSYIVRPVEVANASLLITRSKDGEIGAFHNVCPHRGTQLVTDADGGIRSSFTCPYHAWTFGNDGQLRSAHPPALGWRRCSGTRKPLWLSAKLRFPRRTSNTKNLD